MHNISSIPPAPDDFGPCIFIAPSTPLDSFFSTWVDCSYSSLSLFSNFDSITILKWANFYNLQSLLPFHPLHSVHCYKTIKPLSNSNFYLISDLATFIDRNSSLLKHKTLNVDYTVAFDIAFKLACTLSQEGLWHTSLSNPFDTLHTILNDNFLGTFDSISSFCKQVIANYISENNSSGIISLLNPYINYNELYNYEFSKDQTYIQHNNNFYFFAHFQ